MGRRNAKKTPNLLSKKRSAQRLQLPAKIAAASQAFRPQSAAAPPTVATAALQGAKAAKKKAGSRLWMRLESNSRSEVVELDKGAIIKCAGIPARDLRILGPIFSNSSNILAREKAMVINLEFIKAIVTADEVLVLDPLCQEVIPFIDQLRHQLPFKSPLKSHEPDHAEMQSKDNSATEQQCQKANETPENEHELPFEFQVLEIALEVVCTYLDSSVANLEKDAYPVLDELALKVSSKNLERVRSLKSNLTRLLARVQKVRDEIEHLLDDNEDMADLYLTRKQIQNQQVEALITSAASNGPNLSRQESASIISNIYADEDNVEDLEMLLEAYFVQLDGIRNKILSVREYIDDTEDYVNIQLDNQRNELIQLQLILTMASFAIAVNTYIVGAFAMNIPCPLYEMQHIFTPFVGGTSSGCAVIFLVLLVYARWKKLLGP